ncbi:formate/nitrite transporter family protein [Marinoscillum furvescens]|uniref:Formate/nitrite transporter FocA (FNT family) n=1 Tax=Marinoscillum furvescens DSM 4134 TaxID=1122208 RepID=A0A3D9LH22_MARFU|nr:formate/nitrite transporter family protein [Marinoscillum furvescens]REE05937.1 formate/nitrite transporter FocA (FNT family) [Marinoscillum furvescens DSM 4134]
MSQTPLAKNEEEILQDQHRIGFREFKRSKLSLFLSGLIAGLEIGFSVLLIGTLLTLFGNSLPEYWMRIMTSAAYPLGFILIIVGKSELYTEHTSLALLPVLTGHASLRELLQLWSLIISGNLLGGWFFALLLSWVGPEKDLLTTAAATAMTTPLLEAKWYVLLTSAILAGWLMGLLSWLAASVESSLSRILIIGLITFVIGLGHLHHCIVGSIEMLCGLYISKTITASDYLHFLAFAILGNTIGGALFVSILKYAQVHTDHPKPE